MKDASLNAEMFKDRWWIKNAEKQARLNEKEVQKLAKRETNAEKQAQNKGTTIAKSCCKRLETMIASVQKTLRVPGAANVPEVQQVPLRELLASLETLHQDVQAVSTNREDAAGFTAPPLEKQLAEAAKKHQALFAVAAKTSA